MTVKIDPLPPEAVFTILLLQTPVVFIQQFSRVNDCHFHWGIK